MTQPTTTVVQMPYRNPHASEPLILPVQVVCNTSDDELYRNIRRNAALDLSWAGMHHAHDRVAVLCGGGPSLADHIDEIRVHFEAGAQVFAMNGAASFLRKHGIESAQVLADAKPETASLVDEDGWHFYVASQCDAATVDRARDAGGVTMWHLAIDEEIDRLFPEHRRKAGGYALIGGGASVGNSALCLAYVLGYRRMEVYGYDSSHRGTESHAYPQPMNDLIPVVAVEWAGNNYLASVAMKAQAEKFQITGQALKREGCTINVHGDGLLPAMWNTPPADLAECDKYRLMWSTEAYRHVSPGEHCVPVILDKLRPDGLVLDFGCGTGRASLGLHRAGLPVLCIDFADNCRDEEAMGLPFLQWDLTRPLPPHAKYGICTDVMEHIPTEDVEKVVANIMAAADRVFFQISTVPDVMGEIIGHHLHLTVQPHAWWTELLGRFGRVEWHHDAGEASMFVITGE
jgi:hypothetical protein